MKRINAHFEIIYDMNRVQSGVYSGTITIDRPKSNKGYILLDFKPTKIDAIVSENRLSFNLPEERHECIDSVLESIKLKDIIPEESYNTEYHGKIKKSVNPNKWIGEYLRKMTWNFNYSNKSGIRDDY